MLVVERACWGRGAVLRVRLMPGGAVKALGGLPKAVTVREIVETREKCSFGVFEEPWRNLQPLQAGRYRVGDVM